MKNIKRFGALLLALATLLSLCVTVFAEGETGTTAYKIIIDNPVSGETYSAYKIFDATYKTTTTGEGESAVTTTSVAYTIKESDAWFDVVMGFMGFTKIDSKWKTGTGDSATEATAPYSGNGMTLTPSADGTQYVVSVTTSQTGDNVENFSAPDFAAYLNAKKPESVTADGTATPTYTEATTEGAEGTWTGKEISVTAAGYYFVDTTLGALCSLDTTTPTVIIYEKNSEPTIDKQVFNPSSDKVYENTYTPNSDETRGNGAWKDVKENDTHNQQPATVDVCQEVYYQLVVNTGTNNNGTGTGVDADYIIEDTLPVGFSIVGTGTDGAVQADDVKIKSGSDTDNWTSENTTTTDGTNTTTGGYTVTYTAATDSGNAAKLTITLNAAGKLATLAQNTNITITYAATMAKETVKIGMNGQTTDGTTSAANTNTATLYYQKRTVDGTETNVVRSTDDATVYTYQIGGTTTGEGGTTIPIIQKVDGTDGANNAPLAGVKFILSKKVGDATKYAEVTATQTNTTGKGESATTTAVNGSYYLYNWTDNKPETGNIITSDLVYDTTDTSKVVGGGSIEVKGLDAGTYYLTEVETLDGYNLLTGDITIVIAENGTVKYYDVGKTPATGDDINDGKDTIQIINKSGTGLPSTGGIGTTVFYVVGAVLVLGAVVILITRRRMNNAK